MPVGSPDLNLVLDISEIEDLPEQLQKRIGQQANQAVQGLAAMTHAHVIEQAQQRLKSRREMFLKGLRFHQETKNIWVITVDQSARWIEDGMPPHSMLDDLLKSKKAKRAKDGSTYLVVPFKHGGAPTRSTPAQNTMSQTIKQELQKRNIPFKKIERNPDGSAKTGLLHKLDIDRPQQNKPAPGHEGPASKPYHSYPTPHGQEGPAGRPWLWGVRIYQRPQSNPDGSPKMDKLGRQKVSRDIMTFRVASSKQKGRGLWDHPGLEGMNFLDDAYQWAEQQWDTAIKPSLLRGVGL